MTKSIIETSAEASIEAPVDIIKDIEDAIQAIETRETWAYAKGMIAVAAKLQVITSSQQEDMLNRADDNLWAMLYE